MTIAPDAIETAANADNATSDANSEKDNLTFRRAVEDWLSSLREALARAVDIAALEARLAALSLAQILIIACACGLLLATAWIALLGAVITYLHHLGLTWICALLLVAVVNFILACAGGFAIYRLSHALLFKTTRKILFQETHPIDETDHAAAESSVQHTPTAQ